MFYDLPDPLQFVNDIAEILADDGIWHTEQSYMPSMMVANAYDTACQEHLEYYGLAQLKWMADRANLKIIGVSLNDINGGSFAVSLAKKDSIFAEATADVAALIASERNAGLATSGPYLAFARRVEAHRDALVTLVREIKSAGQTIIGYGASTKGNVLLQYCGFGPSDLLCIAEVNPDKFGCFTPGTGIPIVSEEEAHAMKPDYLLVLPWHFRNTIIKRESDYLERGGHLLFPLPTIEIV
jgi:NDP-4-keto-2,6-dideoxyhexose 3-C-methyltransferase